MIVEYHRPESLEEALALLSRTEVDTVPLGGGTALKKDTQAPLAVVDLQALGLNTIRWESKHIEIGATVTLQTLIDIPGLPPALYQTACLETTYNLRQVATVAGTLVASNGRSPFTVAMLALDAVLSIGGQRSALGLGDLLPQRPEILRHRLITHVGIPSKVRLAYEYVARTPVDEPIVCVAVAQWPSGRTRVTLGGYGVVPVLAMDGPEPGGAEIAARSAYSQSGDERASADYRAEMAEVLTRRGLHAISEMLDAVS
jgi:CO/xanthine dehydrogenase FAD-binding subunit